MNVILVILFCSLFVLDILYVLQSKSKDRQRAGILKLPTLVLIILVIVYFYFTLF